MRMFLAFITLRFFSTDELLAALDLLCLVNPDVLENPDDVRKSKLKIAQELIRRGVVFW